MRGSLHGILLQLFCARKESKIIVINVVLSCAAGLGASVCKRVREVCVRGTLCV